MKRQPKDTDYFAKRFHSKDEKDVYSDRVLTAPNILTMSRLVALPPLLWFLGNIEHYGPWPTLALGAWMLLSDLLDGTLAKALNQISLVGALLDPVVDKIVINSLAIVLAFKGYVPIWGVIPIFVRDLGLVIFGLRVLLDFDKLVTPTIYGRVTPLLWVITFTLSLIELDLAKWIFLSLSITMTIVSGIIYFARYRNLIKLEK